MIDRRVNPNSFVLARAGEITPRGYVTRFHNGENMGTVYLSILATLSPETSRAQRAELILPLNPICPRGIVAVIRVSSTQSLSLHRAARFACCLSRCRFFYKKKKKKKKKRKVESGIVWKWHMHMHRTGNDWYLVFGITDRQARETVCQ